MFSVTPGDANSCTHISSTQLLAPNIFTAPAGQRTLGGLDFTLQCGVSGGTAKATIALANTTPMDPTKLHVYKKDTKGTITNITKQVTLANTPAGLTITYSLTDGATFDDDNQANSQIVDPVYIAVEGEALASTGLSVVPLIAGSSLCIVVGIFIVARLGVWKN